MRPQTVVERLDFVAKRIQGLKFTPPTQLKPGDDQGCFMSCEMYYIEIKIDQSHQTVKDVIISHGNAPEGVSCPVLRKVLQDQDFETFAKHLSGLHSIYSINTSDKKMKQKAYPALTALETDLTILYDHQRQRIKNCHDIVHKSPLGIMEPRKGGLPVRLTYFITPYDLVDTTHKGLNNPSVNYIIDKNLGLSVTVEIEGSSTHKLQIKSLISTQLNTSLPAYAPFNGQNSEKLPAQFVLKLSQPLPMLITSIQQIISEINEPATIKEYLTSITTNSRESLISLIARQELDLNKGPFCRTLDTLKIVDSDNCDLQKHVYSVKLLDLHHVYHILDHYLEKKDGVYVTKIPFTHPTSIPNILRVLRQQALFNFVVGSCIRRNKTNNSNQHDENATKLQQDTNIFDITPVSLNNICVSFEHPSKESLAMLEIDVRELSCQLYALDKEGVCSNEYATTVLQKCWSIPITLRSVLKKCNERRLALLEDANKRRERELQELLTNNSTQQGLQYKSNLHYQETLLQSKFSSLDDKSNVHDLNSIAEFLNAKVTSSNTESKTQDDASSESNRTNLLRKFSCKPKAKQTTSAATKNQTGNKILSLMLKRPNPSSSSSEDASLKATLTKKIKTKITESSVKSALGSTSTTTTKLISPEVANAARLASKQSKQANPNVSLSLIRSPSKNQSSSMAIGVQPINVNLAPQVIATGTTSGQSNIRIKPQPNGSNNSNKPRKNSIVSVIDKLVGAVNPESSLASSSADSNSDSSAKNMEPFKGSPLGPKTKSRVTSDQFAVKQGSSGGLKLTLAKSKPGASSSSASSSSAATASPSPSTPISSSSVSSAPILPSSNSNTPASANPMSKTEAVANKILGLGSSGPTIKYTIPKISKTQTSSSNPGDSNQTSSATSSDGNTPAEDSANILSSSGLGNSAINIAATKRTTPTPFNRNAANINRISSVSSSTHPLNRTTSNSLANTNRPTSVGNNDGNLTNRLTGNNQNQQIMRQHLNYRMANVQQAQQHQQQSQAIQQQQVMQRFVSPPNINMNQLVSDTLQRTSPSVINAPPQFYLRQPMFNDLNPNKTVTKTPTININNLTNEAAIQPTLLGANRKIVDTNQAPQPPPSMIPMGALNFQPRINEGLVSNNPLLANMISEMSSAPSSSFTPSSVKAIPFETSTNLGVTSSSDPKSPTISDPSSPTECSQEETVKPPPLIPIDSLEEPQAVSPELDHPDDESDRLSIIDINENLADSNDVAGTPKQTSSNSPLYNQSQMIPTSSSNSTMVTAPESTTSSQAKESTVSEPMEVDSIDNTKGDQKISDSADVKLGPIVTTQTSTIETSQAKDRNLNSSQATNSSTQALPTSTNSNVPSNATQVSISSSTSEPGIITDNIKTDNEVEQQPSIVTNPKPSSQPLNAHISTTTLTPTNQVQQQSNINSSTSSSSTTTTTTSIAASTTEMI